MLKKPYVTLICVFGILFLAEMAAGRDASSALVNWEKQNAWRRKILHETLKEVAENGSFRYTIRFIRQFDQDSNGEITPDEAGAIEAYLEELAPAKTGTGI